MATRLSGNTPLSLLHIRTLAIACGLLAVAACGGDDDDDAQTRDGNAIDGYLLNAIACVDVNFNGVCDSGEATSRTASSPRNKGQFSIVTDNESAPTLVRVIADETFETDINGDNVALVDEDYSLRAPASASVVTPLTTLVQAEAERVVANNADTSIAEAVNQAKSVVKQQLSNGNVDGGDLLNDDYITGSKANNTVAATASSVRRLLQKTRSDIDAAAGTNNSGNEGEMARDALSARKITGKLSNIASQIEQAIDSGDSPGDAADTAANDPDNKGDVDSNTINNEIGEVLADLEEAEQIAEEEEDDDATGATGGSGG